MKIVMRIYNFGCKRDELLVELLFDVFYYKRLRINEYRLRLVILMES